MKKGDQITGIIVLIFSGFVIEESLRMPEQALAGRASFAPWPGFLPFWVGVVMAVLSVLLIVQASLRPADPTRKSVFPGRQALIAVVFVLASQGMYIALLERLGYLVDTVLFNGFLLRVVMRERWKMTILVALSASAGLYVLFQVFLEVDLPKNMFGF